MSSLPLADRLLVLSALPLVLLALLLAAMPWHIGLPLAPQVLWLVALTLGVSYPPAWPPLGAFLLGLVSDTLSATPLGSQALLVLLLSLSMRAQARRLQHQLFRVRWMGAAAMLLVVNLMLWGIAGWVNKLSLPILPVVRATLVTALWFPLFHVLTEQLVRLFPARN